MNITYHDYKKFNSIETIQNKNVVIIKYHQISKSNPFDLCSMSLGKYYVAIKTDRYYELLTYNDFGRNSKAKEPIRVIIDKRFIEYHIAFWIEKNDFTKDSCELLPCIHEKQYLNIYTGEFNHNSNNAYYQLTLNQSIRANLILLGYYKRYKSGIKKLFDNSLINNQAETQGLKMHESLNTYLNTNTDCVNNVRILPPMLNYDPDYQISYPKNFQTEISKLQQKLSYAIDSCIMKQLYNYDLSYNIIEESISDIQQRILSTHPNIINHSVDLQIGMDPIYLLI